MKNKSENKKALPKFLTVLITATIGGGIVGFFMGFAGSIAAPEKIVQTIYNIIASDVHYAMGAVLILCSAASFIIYRKAKLRYEAWDREDEETIEKTENMLSWVLLITTVETVLGFAFFGIGIILSKTSFDVQIMAVVTGFVLLMVSVMITQQKIVDLTKKINPEKKGSVYDFNFQKKWLASCDENEMRQIGQASYKSFIFVTNTCIALWLLLIMVSSIYDIGVLPLIVVMFIWGVSQITYCLEAIKLGLRK